MAAKVHLDGTVELTAREAETMELMVVEGLSTAEVAQSLGLSYRHLRRIVGSIMSKYGYNSEEELRKYGLSAYIIPR